MCGYLAIVLRSTTISVAGEIALLGARIVCYDCESRGEVSERLKELASKASVGGTLPWVQIPPSPPVFPFTRMLRECAWALEMAGGGAALFEVALVVVLGSIKRAGWGDFCGDGLAEIAAGLQRGLRFFRNGFLLRRMEE